jgi:hypothetical protein
VVSEGGIDERERRNGIELAPDPRGRKHDSMTPFYRLLRQLDRELRARDGVPINVSLASSVKIRREQDPSYTAPSLSEWLTGGGENSEL